MESAYAAQGAAFLQTCGAEVLGLDMSGVQAPQTVEISDFSGEPTAVGTMRLPIPLAPTESRILGAGSAEPPPALLDAQRSLALLTDVGSALASAPGSEAGSEAALEHVARLLLPLLADWCLVDTYDARGQRQRVAAAADPHLLPLLRDLPLCFHDEPPSSVRLHPPHTWQPVSSADVAQPPAASAEPEIDDRLPAPCLHALDLSSCLTLPLSAHGRLLGVLTLAMGESGRVYSSADLPLAEEVARRIALTLDNARSQLQWEEQERCLQELADRLVMAQEEERRQVAYDVHDGVAQVATSLHQHLQTFAQEMDQQVDGQAPPALHAELARIVELAKRTVRELRQVVGHLRPALLEECGLGSALCRLVADLRAEGWRITYTNALDSERLPRAVETVLFRIAQEALNNVRKHARTTEVEVTLGCRGDLVALEVRDRGCGFDPEAVTQAGAEEHVGLHSMRDRVKLLGGRCEILSRPGDGTRVVAEVQVVLSGRSGEMGAGL